MSQTPHKKTGGFNLASHPVLGEIDLSDLYRSLTGNEATEAAAIQLAVNQTGAGAGVLDLTGDTDVTFADIRTAFNANAGLFAMESSLDDLQVALIEIDAAQDVSADTLDGSIFAVISDSNQGLSASDMMFEVAAVGTIDFNNQNDFILS